MWPGSVRKQDGRPIHTKQYVYRLVYEAATGEPCPEGLIAHHECENPSCINPWHLKFITQGDHLIGHGLPGDWGQADKTHCPQGHEYTPANTYTYVTKDDGSTERHCRICRKAAKARYNAKQRKA